MLLIVILNEANDDMTSSFQFAKSIRGITSNSKIPTANSNETKAQYMFQNPRPEREGPKIFHATIHSVHAPVKFYAFNESLI